MINAPDCSQWESSFLHLAAWGNNILRVEEVSLRPRRFPADGMSDAFSASVGYEQEIPSPLSKWH